MKFPLLFAALLLALSLQGQNFVESPYQGYGLFSPVVADFNGDSLADVLGIHYVDGVYRFVLQVNSGPTPIAFTEKDLALDFDAYGQAAAADLDNDGDLDVVVAKGAATSLCLLRNDGAGNFTADSLGVAGAYELKVADLDNDGDPDIAGMDAGNNKLFVYLNDGNLNFTVKTVVSGTDNLELFDIADMDGDGDVDIVAGFSQSSGKEIVLYNNLGNGNFQGLNIVFNNFYDVYALVVADINGDGRPDILSSKGFFDSDVFINKGNLAFEQKALVSANSLINKIQTGDYNGDGRKDVMIGTNSGGITWYKNLSNTTLEFEAQTVGGVSPSYSITNGDLDNDGDTDVVVSNGEFWWYENQILQEPSGTLTFSEKAVSVFPNPFQDVLEIRNLGGDAYTLELTDVNGRRVYAAAVSGERIDLSLLHSGVYFLALTNTNTQQTRSTSIVKLK